MTPELLTVSELSERLKVGRSTVFEWLRDGVFLPGKHFVKVGRVLRFVWSQDIVAALAEATNKPQQPAKRRRSASGAETINWDY
jgi:excisionase family DNA binding protein